jgi:3-oxoacyl-[acyl-carrier protein] reductase
LQGKVALITGASRGIGRAIALAMARAGASVAIGFIRDEDGANAVRQEIEAFERRCISVRADVSRREEVIHLAGAVQRSLGEIDVLVNNAGVASPRALDALTEKDWHEAIAVNLTSAFYVTQAVVPAMRRRRWGRIINISSTAAQVGGVVGPHYAASKAGILGLTRGYASQLVKDGITVNAIAPALIETDMTTSNPNVRSDLIPLGRFGAVDEVAQVAVMLACNGYITGQTLNVNGGAYLS